MEPNKRTEEEKKTKAFVKRSAEFARMATRSLNRRATGMLFAFAFLPCVGLVALASSDTAADYSADENSKLLSKTVAAAAVTSPVLPTTTTTMCTTTTSVGTTTTTSTTAITTTSPTTTVATSAVEIEPEVVKLANADSTAAEQAEIESESADFVEEAEAEAAITESSTESWTITRVSDEELIMLAKTVAQEGGDCSYTQQACVVWTVLNRVDSSAWPNTVYENLVKPNQFAYKPGKEYRADHYQVVVDVVMAWENGGERLLSPEYQSFWGDGWRNHFYGNGTGEYVPD